MSRLSMSLLVFAGALPLAGCSAFYPNWGATGLPENEITISPSVGPSESTSPEASASETASPSSSASASETASPAPTKQNVTVEILFAASFPEDGVLEVVAQVPNLAERVGVCELKLTGPTSLVLSSAAEPSSDFMQCAPFDIQLESIISGRYQAVVSYDSDDHTGVSAPVQVDVP